MIIQNRLMFKVMFSAAAAMHVSFMVMFLNAGALPLVILNFFSIAIYITGVIAAFVVRSFDKHILSMTLIVYAEVTAHAIVATLLVGFEPCFLLYAISILPMCAFTLFPVSKKTFMRSMLVMSFISTVLIIATLIVNDRIGILSGYILRTEQVNVMRLINIIFNLVLVFGFSFLFVNQMNNLLKELSDTNDNLNYIASHDALTGLYNRHSLWKHLSDIHGSVDNYCVCMGDIDNFKKTNDTYGHDCGDQVLKKIAGVITGNISEADFACRWGGEEILIIMKGSRAECHERVVKMRRAICGLDIMYEGQPVPTTMTFGFADSSENPDPDDAHMEELISLADKRLYRGKKSGKNVVISQD